MQASVTLDTRQFEKLTTAVLKQFPYAVSQTLNGMAYETQQTARRELPQHFQVRRRSFLEQSIKVTRSTKQTLVSEVSVPPRPRSAIDQAMALQQFGGQRQGAVPIEGARPTPQSITTPSKWPGKLKRRVDLKIGEDILVLQRTGRRKSASAKRHRHHPALPRPARDPNLKPMYWLNRGGSRVVKRWNLIETAREQVKGFAKRFQQELAQAIRSARV